ncbi:MAG: hypothetical protein LUC44_04315 [Prevotellaceae bacterium]|nr:hypothetical protein [Prevotellaceae bacterium]
MSKEQLSGKDEPALTISIKSAYPGNVLSIYYPSNFVVDGVTCRSLASFLTALGCSDKEEQNKVCGREVSKEEVNAVMRKSTFYWDSPPMGVDFLGIEGNIYNAIFALSEQSEEFRKALVASGKKELTCPDCPRVGKKHNSSYLLSEAEYCYILWNLRLKLQETSEEGATVSYENLKRWGRVFLPCSDRLGESMSTVNFYCGTRWKQSYLLDEKAQEAYQWIDEFKRLKTLTYEDVAWDKLKADEALSKGLCTVQNLSAHLPVTIMEYKNDTALVKWQIIPNGKYDVDYEDLDPDTIDAEFCLYGIIDRKGKVRVKFRPAKSLQELALMRDEATKLLRTKG